MPLCTKWMMECERFIDTQRMLFKYRKHGIVQSNKWCGEIRMLPLHIWCQIQYAYSMHWHNKCINRTFTHHSSQYTLCSCLFYVYFAFEIAQEEKANRSIHPENVLFLSFSSSCFSSRFRPFNNLLFCIWDFIIFICLLQKNWHWYWNSTDNFFHCLQYAVYSLNVCSL